MSESAASVYIHLPFCERLCPYCDFAVAVRREPDYAGYVNALILEMKDRRLELVGRRVVSLYLGGGTPSLFPPDELERLIMALKRTFDLSDLDEVTIEANPRSTSSDSIRRWIEMGINRVSLGIQSFQPQTLVLLGRNHDAYEARRALEQLLVAGMRTSLDLIFCGPEVGLDELLADLGEIVGYPSLGHVSAYQLTVEPQTVFGRRYRQGKLPLPPEDEMVRAYEALQEGLGNLGFSQYEVSSFARADEQGRHNQRYWQGTEYLGLGVGAHSFRKNDAEGIVRRANVKNLKRYLNDREGSAEQEKLTPLDHYAERLFLGVRGAHGVAPEALELEFAGEVDPSYFAQVRRLLNKLLADGFLAEDDDVWTPTATGYALADSVGACLMDFDLPTSS